MLDKNKVIDIALAEVNYLEKASRSDLDSKTDNAGKKNITKYARDLDALNFYNTKKQGVAWCDVFVDWCFVTAYGIEAALKLTCQAIGSAGAGCRYSRDYYKRKGQLMDTPEPGDQIFFWPKNRTKDLKAVQHTGLVVAVDGTYVHTVEGNTSGESGVVYNGGGVYRKKYRLDNVRIAGYGRPDWSMDMSETRKRTLRKGDTGEDVMELQRILNRDSRYNGLKVDGIFGRDTEASVRAFQSDNGLTPDGIVGEKTWAKMRETSQPDEDDEAAEDKPETPAVPPLVVVPNLPLPDWDDLTLEEKVEAIHERLTAVEGVVYGGENFLIPAGGESDV